MLRNVRSAYKNGSCVEMDRKEQVDVGAMEVSWESVAVAQESDNTTLIVLHG